MKKLSIIGIGRLGLCFGLTLEKCGYDVLGVDINADYVEALNTKEFTSDEEGVTEHLRAATSFRATTSLTEAVVHSDILFVIVATPSLDNGRYDHSQVENLITTLEGHARHGRPKHFVVCCTTMPGYCESIRPRLEALNYTVSYNPEFIAQGTILKNQATPDMVLIGEGSDQAGDILQEIYEKHTENSPRIARMTPTEAEITKIALNCFLTTKIAYANMVGDIVLRAGGAPSTVLEAIGADTKIGPKYLRYGYGYGGPCFPRDNRALALYAGDLGVEALVSLASDQSNEKHLEYQLDFYEQNHDKETAVSFESVTYKPESTMIEESQQLAFAVGLATRGFKVVIKERPVVVEQVRALYGDMFQYEEV
jgi:nucleotide sugar dehydrogenase